MAAAQASVQAAGQKAGAYLSSWGTWASERRKGWAESRATTSAASSENVGSTTSVGVERSAGKLSRWGSSASLGGKKTMKEEKGGDGIGRLDA